MNKTLVFIFHYVFDLLYLGVICACAMQFNNWWLLLLLFFLPSITYETVKATDDMNVYELLHKAYLNRQSISSSINNIGGIWVWDCVAEKYIKLVGSVKNGFIGEDGTPYEYSDKRYMLYEPMEINAEFQDDSNDDDGEN